MISTPTIDEITGGSKIIFAGGFTFLTVEMIYTVGSNQSTLETVYLLKVISINRQ